MYQGSPIELLTLFNLQEHALVSARSMLSCVVCLQRLSATCSGLSAVRVGLPDHLIKTLGRWVSGAYQLYIRTPPEVSHLAYCRSSFSWLLLGRVLHLLYLLYFSRYSPVHNLLWLMTSAWVITFTIIYFKIKQKKQKIESTAVCYCLLRLLTYYSIACTGHSHESLRSSAHD
jgi:hypothetical protein